MYGRGLNSYDHVEPEAIIEDNQTVLEHPESEALRIPTITLIDPRQLVRECLRECLSAAFSDHEVVAFASVDEWDRAAIGHRDGDMVVVYYDPREAARGGAGRDTLLARAGPGANLVLLCDSEDPGEI